MIRMKKSTRFFCCLCAGVITGIGMEKATKKKQQTAKIKGTHIPFGPYEAFFKRPLDILLAGSALILLSPIMGITALLVKVKLGSPVLFVQQRPGKNEKIFKIYKFRTMTDKKNENDELLPDEERLTKFGQLLRSTSLDELPELFNILKGDMSIVGPRPLLVEYLERYSDEQKHRHDVRPGLTGYAQAHGRNTVNWNDRFAMDVKYAAKITFLDDVKIIVDTLKTVFKREGISSYTSITMENFIEYCKTVERKKRN